MTKYPVFIFHELVIRFQEIDSSVGQFQSTTIGDNGVIINTTNGSLKVDWQTLEKQYRDPALLIKVDLVYLLKGFSVAKRA